MSPMREALQDERTPGRQMGTSADIAAKSFPLSDGGPAARSWLRQVLHYQAASETARWAYERLAFLLVGASCVLWLAVARPAVVAEAVARMTLVVWVVLFVALLGAHLLERHWLRRQQDVLHRSREEDRSR